MAVDFCGVELGGRVVNGSGTFDAIAARTAFGDALDESFPFDAFVSKTITLEPRAGNPPPRLWETPAGMLNSIGLPNKGLAGFLEHDLPRLAELPVPLIVSVMGHSPDELTAVAAGVSAREEAAVIELNVSCPNVETGLVMGADPVECAVAVTRVREQVDKPLVVKLSPNAADPVAVAQAAERAGADAISLVNTLKGAAFDPRSGEPWLGAGSGGLSGPAIRAVALEQVRAVASAVGVPVVGMGGIQSGRDAADFVRAGATLVAVGTENFRDPAAGTRIAAELRELTGDDRVAASTPTG